MARRVPSPWRRASVVWVAVVVWSVTAVVTPTTPAKPAAAASAAPAPVTPVLSLRRLPGVTASVVGDRRLAASLGPLMAGVGGPAGHACLSVRGPGGGDLFALNPELSLIPASTLKLETATAGLARLGADSHFTTEIRAAAAPAGGTVSGDLWLVGGGDPLLATADFASVAGYHNGPRMATSMEALADRVVAAGVRTVTGRVIGDESRYDTQRYLPSWSPTYAADGEIGPQSALTVNDGFVEWMPKAVPAPDPATNAAAVLTALLRARGVTVGGEPGEGRAPVPAATVAAIDSAPLGDVVGVMLAESDNLAAELLVKELGVRFGGAGTTASGLKVVRAALAPVGPAAATVVPVDGSGLDRSDRLTCDALQATLAHSGENGELGKVLPVAGRNGTLARRFLGTPAAGRIRAKTGSLKGVNALSGWASTADGRSLQFALVANDLPSDAAGTGLEDRVVSALALWPQAPAPADISPLPAAAR
ncbi:MAG TPA: D-alanyl-D-alanine carboxypeptidase/D-alanyl-D-alanine-endopeptidase [Acidimicrobiales bacterium]|nr:D-alanyl-D-alanine carboxypeptidase/D-alanyl-D-alanine-endopeptidase [Acidimicrobiales bacterium]